MLSFPRTLDFRLDRKCNLECNSRTLGEFPLALRLTFFKYQIADFSHNQIQFLTKETFGTFSSTQLLLQHNKVRGDTDIVGLTWGINGKICSAFKWLLINDTSSNPDKYKLKAKAMRVSPKGRLEWW